MNELALFAGAGGGILGGKLLGWKTVCAVEIEPYCRAVLAQRQNDGILAPFPIWDDICTFDGKPWNGVVDVISGGFPCQDISCAGKGAGITGSRSGLWGEMFRVVCEVRPRFVFVENSPMLTIRGLGTVLSDLASVGYDAKWCVLGAADAGGDHLRERIWILAHSSPIGTKQSFQGLRPRTELQGKLRGISWKDRVYRLHHEPTRRSINDVACWLDRHKAIGNGQVPAVEVLAWETLTGQCPSTEKPVTQTVCAGF
jgi:DNA (cytosine-5)-methyltransferase 1